MQQALVSEISSQRLILFFAGWGMDRKVFSDLNHSSYDIMVVWDYTDGESIDMNRLLTYREIVVLAWSMGVVFADRFISHHPTLPITKCVAVNGTLTPIDNVTGIPPSIYDKTALLPDNQAVDKFFRRICGGTGALNLFFPVRPTRNLTELRNELVSIRRQLKQPETPPTSNWDEIFISDNDLIFPPTNMMEAWKTAAARLTVIPKAAHMIDFQKLISLVFADKDLISDRFGAALDTYGSEAEVQRNVARRLTDMAMPYISRTEKAKILEVGSGCGMLTHMYLPLFRKSEIGLIDLSPGQIAEKSDNTITTYVTDAECDVFTRLSDSYDYVFSSSTIQWFNSPRRFISEILRILKPGGMAFISFYIKGTFKQMSDFSGLRYLSPEALDIIGNHIIESKTIEFPITFADSLAALRHLRSTGVNSLHRNPISVTETRRLLNAISNSDGSATLTFNAIFLIIQK